MRLEGHYHGVWKREPVVWVESGSRISFKTLDVSWGLEPPTDLVTPRKRWEPREDGPCMTGPVGIRDAQPGQALEIRMLRIRPGNYGFTYAGGTGWFNADLNRRLGVADERVLVRWTLDQDAKANTGWEVPLRPFPGTLGLCPANPESAWFPTRTGGNMDCKELVEGTTLYLPIEVEGGLLSVGDGHAAQGDGELCGMAIECPMEEVEVEVHVRDLTLTAPLLRTPDSTVTLGFDRDLDKAIDMALNAMLDYIQQELELTRPLALAYATIYVDTRITQLVNDVRGVHCVLRDR